MPDHLRDANRDAEDFGHGQGYLYPHAFRDHWVAQQYLPDTLQGRVFYQPTDQGFEATIRDQVARRREEQLAAMMETEFSLDWALARSGRGPATLNDDRRAADRRCPAGRRSGGLLLTGARYCADPQTIVPSLTGVSRRQLLRRTCWRRTRCWWQTSCWRRTRHMPTRGAAGICR